MAVTKPTEFPDIAVEANDPSRILKPDEPTRTQGWNPSQSPSAQVFNWFHQRISQWTRWLVEHVDAIDGKLTHYSEVEAELKRVSEWVGKKDSPGTLVADMYEPTGLVRTLATTVANLDPLDGVDAAIKDYMDHRWVPSTAIIYTWLDKTGITPIGTVMMDFFSQRGNDSAHWLRCNGTEIPTGAEYNPIRNLINSDSNMQALCFQGGRYYTPDFSKRFPRGSYPETATPGTTEGGTFSGNKGGAKSTKLVDMNLPLHNHTNGIYDQVVSTTQAYINAGGSDCNPTGFDGGTVYNELNIKTSLGMKAAGYANPAPVSILPEYIAINFYMRIK